MKDGRCHSILFSSVGRYANRKWLPCSPLLRCTLFLLSLLFFIVLRVRGGKKIQIYEFVWFTGYYRSCCGFSFSFLPTYSKPFPKRYSSARSRRTRTTILKGKEGNETEKKNRNPELSLRFIQSISQPNLIVPPHTQRQVLEKKGERRKKKELPTMNSRWGDTTDDEGDEDVLADRRGPTTFDDSMYPAVTPEQVSTSLLGFLWFLWLEQLF